MATIPDRTPAEMYDRRVALGSIDPSCPSCVSYFGAPGDPLRNGDAFAPRHEASDRCQSGKRAHCTCDTCF